MKMTIKRSVVNRDPYGHDFDAGCFESLQSLWKKNKPKTQEEIDESLKRWGLRIDGRWTDRGMQPYITTVKNYNKAHVIREFVERKWGIKLESPDDIKEFSLVYYFSATGKLQSTVSLSSKLPYSFITSLLGEKIVGSRTFDYQEILPWAGLGSEESVSKEDADTIYFSDYMDTGKFKSILVEEAGKEIAESYVSWQIENLASTFMRCAHNLLIAKNYESIFYLGWRRYSPVIFYETKPYPYKLKCGKFYKQLFRLVEAYLFDIENAPEDLV